MSSYDRTFHGDGNTLIKKFSSHFGKNFFVLFDNQNNIDKNTIHNKYDSQICLYNNDDFNKYNFNRPINLKHRWGNHQNPKYFYAHFRMLVFYISNPNYDYYWFFDDDVDFTGNLKDFLNEYNEYNDDFIAIQAFKKENYTNLPRISVINNRMSGSHGNWLHMCPGPGDNFKSIDIHIGSFFPIVRFSNRAMKYLLDLNNNNFYGYSEGFVPTSLASAGFTVSSMKDEFNNYFIDKNIDCQLLHKGIQFTWEWL